MQFPAQPHFKLANSSTFTVCIIKSNQILFPLRIINQNRDGHWPKARPFNYSNEILNKLIGSSWQVLCVSPLECREFCLPNHWAFSKLYLSGCWHFVVFAVVLQEFVPPKIPLKKGEH